MKGLVLTLASFGSKSRTSRYDRGMLSPVSVARKGNALYPIRGPDCDTSILLVTNRVGAPSRGSTTVAIEQLFGKGAQ